jgi:hypothetical protein
MAAAISQPAPASRHLRARQPALLAGQLWQLRGRGGQNQRGLQWAQDDDCDGQVDEGVWPTPAPTTAPAPPFAAALPVRRHRPRSATARQRLRRHHRQHHAGPAAPTPASAKRAPPACDDGKATICRLRSACATHGRGLRRQRQRLQRRIDDNIAGMGSACGANQGECKAGVQQCVGGKVAASAKSAPRPKSATAKTTTATARVDNNIASAACGIRRRRVHGRQHRLRQRQADLPRRRRPARRSSATAKTTTATASTMTTPPTPAAPAATASASVGRHRTMRLRQAGLHRRGTGPRPRSATASTTTATADRRRHRHGVGDKLRHRRRRVQKRARWPARTRRGSAGAWSAPAGSIGPTKEICDGKDNDCDGETDEDFPEVGQPAATNVGECQAGTWKCVNGQLECDGGSLPQPEVCDGKDNDCNGAIDDNVPGEGVACGSSVGECKDGKTKCVGAKLICGGVPARSTEICDGKDNDCDGQPTTGRPVPATAAASKANAAALRQRRVQVPWRQRLQKWLLRARSLRHGRLRRHPALHRRHLRRKVQWRDLRRPRKVQPADRLLRRRQLPEQGLSPGQTCINYQCIENPCPPGKCASRPNVRRRQMRRYLHHGDLPPADRPAWRAMRQRPLRGLQRLPENFVCVVNDDGKPTCEATPAR